jgi:hypothetical protein
MENDPGARKGFQGDGGRYLSDTSSVPEHRVVHMITVGKWVFLSSFQVKAV